MSEETKGDKLATSAMDEIKSNIGTIKSFRFTYVKGELLKLEIEYATPKPWEKIDTDIDYRS